MINSDPSFRLVSERSPLVAVLLCALFCLLALSSVASAQDSDGQLIAAAGVTEPVALPSTATGTGSAVDVFDFRLLDGATGDGLALNITQVVLHTSGTASSTIFNQVVWRLNGPDVSNAPGTYSSGANTITFSGLSISVSNGGLEAYTVNAYYGTNTGLTEGQTFILSIDGDVDLTLGAGTLMSGSNGTISNSTGSTVDITATKLTFTTQPSGSVSGSALTTQPVVAAQDAAGNTDTGFSETVSLSESSSGSLSNATATASSGVATFSGLSYTATADGESFTLTANDQDGVGTDLPTVNANAVSSDVVATQLVFATQPSGSVSGSALTTQPVVEARDANGVKDTGFSETVSLSESSSGSLSNATATASSGVATFSSLSYTATADGESFTLTANDQDGVGTDLPTVNANAVSSDVVATQLVFTTQPAPLAVTSGTALDFSTDPVVEARDANGTKDTGFTDTVTLTETGAGTATYTNNSVAAVAGVATFTGMTMTYTAAVHGETFSLQADDTAGGSEGDISTLPSSSSFTAQAIDSDATLVAAAGVSEPVALPSTANSSSAAVGIFDFTLGDGATADGLSLSVSQIVLHTSGTGPFSQLAFLLNGPDASAVAGTYSSGANTLTFSGLSISVANGSSETYTVSAYYATNSGLTENQTFILSLDGDTDLTVAASGTQMSGANAALSNGTGSKVAVTATQLVLTTAPADTRAVDSSDEVLSGSAFLTQPVVTARDAALNIDADFVDLVQASVSSGSGSLAGSASATASAGTATFGSLRYDAASDGETFVLSFDDQSGGAEGDLSAVTTASLSADIVATQWVFSRQPAGSFAGLALTTQPQVEARDALGKVDTDISSAVALAISPAGSLTNAAATSSSGVATFSGLIATGVGTQRTLTVSGGSLSSATSVLFDVQQAQGTISFQGASTVVFDGLPKTRISAVSPSGLSVTTTYNGSSTPPTGPGTYEVVATIADAIYAGSATTELKILPPAAPVASLRAEPSEGAVPLRVQFTNESEGFGYTFLETFNDAGQTFDDPTSVEVVYETPGVYEAVLTIKGQGGQAQTRASIVVHGPPQLSANALSAEGEAGEVLLLSLRDIDADEGSWSVGAIESALVAAVEIEGDQLRAVPVAASAGMANVELSRTNKWGLRAHLKIDLRWLPVDGGTEEVADGDSIGVASGAPGAAGDSSGALVDGTGPSGESEAAVGDGATATGDSIAVGTAPIAAGDSTAVAVGDSASLAAAGTATTDSTIAVGDDASLADNNTGLADSTAASSGAPANDGTGAAAGDDAGSAEQGDAALGGSVETPAYVDQQGQLVRGLFNGDMVVDLDDFFLFANHFGMALGRDGFDPSFDLDQNGVIDLADFFIFADNFGREAVAPF